MQERQSCCHGNSSSIGKGRSGSTVAAHCQIPRSRLASRNGGFTDPLGEHTIANKPGITIPMKSEYCPVFRGLRPYIVMLCFPRGAVTAPHNTDTREACGLGALDEAGVATASRRGRRVSHTGLACARKPPQGGHWSIARGGVSREAASRTLGGAPKTDRPPEMDALVGGARRHLSAAPVARRSRRHCGAPKAFVFYGPPSGKRCYVICGARWKANATRKKENACDEWAIYDV